MMKGSKKVADADQREASAAQYDGYPEPSTRPEPMEAWFDPDKRLFWLENPNKEWVKLSKNDFSPLLRLRGFSRVAPSKGGLTWLEAEILRIQMTRVITYAGPLAGFTSGLKEICGMKFLITEAPRVVKAKKGGWPTLRKYFRELLGKQQLHFFGWLKASRASLSAGPPWRSGHILVIAGPAGCGKNLLQDIITEILGGRAAKPFRYMTGETTFNKELLSSEHLIIQDEVPHQDYKSRRIFGARLKDFSVNRLHSFHPKGKDAVTLTPFWRLTISLNEETENLRIIPPLEDALLEKMTFFRCGKTNLPITGHDPREIDDFWNMIKKEIPGFLAWLEKWKIPEKLVDPRYGCKCWHDAYLLNEIDSLSEEAKLWNMIESSEIIPNTPYGLECSSADLERELRKHFPVHQLDKLLPYSNTCGKFLHKLSVKHPKRIHAVRGENNTNRWRLLPPEKPADAF